MHRVVPELIVENFRAGRFRGDFQAVGMFLDLTGFSKLTDTLMQHGQHGAEVLASLMHGVFDPLVETIFHHGGKIVSFAGDGIMALFPVDSDDKQTVVHALAAGWHIQNTFLSNPDRQTVYGNFHFSVKVGMAVGPVSWGILRSGDGLKATYYFRGQAVEDSARVEHRAQAGEILVTENIYALLQNEINVSPRNDCYRLTGFNFNLPDPTPIDFPPVDVEITRLFMPEEVITQNIRGEFRQIVNLFMRIPDLPYEKLQAFSELIFELHEKYGGLVNRVDFGDKGCNLLMLWGAPVTYENDITRTLNFVLELRARVDFPVTAGVTYYVAHSGYLGSVMYEDYTCYGWGVNLASRFMMTAQAGEIWIDERIARRVKHRFAFTFHGTQAFKGFAEQQQVYILSGHKAAEATQLGEFVGREVELPRLIDALNPVWEDRFAGLMAIWGEAGSGKSRLLAELKNSLTYAGREFLWAHCPADQILRQSLNPFQYWLEHQFEFDLEMDDEARRHRFDEYLDRLIHELSNIELAAELERVRSVLGALVDLHWEDSLYSHLEAEVRYSSTLHALIDLLKAESLRQPVILILEDIHFVDEDSLVLLARLKKVLLAEPIGFPIAILVTSRLTGRESELSEALIDQSMLLSQLSTQALFDLAEVYLDGRVSPDLIRMLEARSEGNPYFVEQILIYLQEENLLEMSERGWRVKRRLPESALPADIQALLIARLDQLSRRVRTVIQTASVLGREFAVQILQEMLPGANDLTVELKEATQANIWLPSQQHSYIFTHALLRDAAYGMQIRAQRIELHASALHALERVYTEELEHHYEELAHHAEQARLVDKALYYLRKAGQVTADTYRNNLALEYYTRALAFVAPDNLIDHFDIVAERVELYSRLGKRDLQHKDLDALLRWAETLGDVDRQSRALMLRATYHYVMGNYSDSIECASQAEKLSSTTADTDLGFFTQLVWSQALLHTGRLDEAMDRANAALLRTRIVGNRREEARLLSSMGLIALEQKEPADAQKYMIDALAITREIKDPSLEARALNNLARSEEMVNRNYVVARSYYEQSYKIAHEIGDRNAESFTLSNLGFVAGLQGDFVAARYYYEQALLVAREIGNRPNEMYNLINLSAVTGVQNDSESALRYAQQALELAGNISDRSGEAWACLYLGRAYFLNHQFQEAMAAYHRSVEIRYALSQPALSMEPIAGLVEIYMERSELEAASDEAEKILSFLEGGARLDGTDEPLRVYYVCYLYLKKIQDPRAEQILQTAANLLEQQVSNFTDELARKRYIENIPWRLAIYEASRPN